MEEHSIAAFHEKMMRKGCCITFKSFGSQRAWGIPVNAKKEFSNNLKFFTRLL